MKGLSLEECLEWDLKEQISRLLHISRDKLDIEENLADFGFDSISLTRLAASLTEYYGIMITPAHFFGYSTLEKLIRYFLTEHGEAIAEFYRDEPKEEDVAPSLQIVKILPKAKNPSTSSYSACGDSKDISEPIAVIGMSGRFPMAETIDQLWSNLANGRKCITEIPRDRWDWRDYYGDPRQDENKTNSKWGAFIQGIDKFDPLFFEISPREAGFIDPQHRLFLEESWKTLENAGYMGEQIRGKLVGVYVGVEESQYALLAAGSGQINSNQMGTLPARIAYKLDLKGPNLAITASCSSGLVAVHQACQSLRQGDCEMALAGAANLIISPLLYLGLSKSDMVSPDGECRVFDQFANGLVPGEAVAVVLLKPLSKAIRDKDHIYGCIRASGVNYNGKSNGITAPNLLSQATLIENVYDKYRINPEDIQYVLSHSVGSKIGDSVEFQALTQAFNKYPPRKQMCALGSIKALVGHSFAASGVLSLISMLMAMKNHIIPATFGCDQQSEYINLKGSPFYLNKENRQWTTGNNGRRMGTISTSGISGTNAHAVIEEYLPPSGISVPVSSIASPHIMVFSARNRDRLQEIARQMVAFLEAENDLVMTDLAFTLQTGREAMSCRLAIVAADRNELVAGLREYLGVAGDVKAIESRISIFVGDPESESHDISDKRLISTEASAFDSCLRDNDAAEIALYWVKGGRIPWKSLHEDDGARKIPLPVYPFEKRRCWVDGQSWTVMEKEQNTHDHDDDCKFEQNVPVNELVIEILSNLLGMEPEELNCNKSLERYGLDSILLMGLLQQLQSRIDPTMNLVKLRECKTILDITNIVRPYMTGRKLSEVTQGVTSIPAAWPQFPELIHLNDNLQGRPVFWFHGGMGGVEVYQTIARKIQRPFYGIQARGYMTDRPPLNGIQAMAAYYVHIIQTLQPYGPYDLGGYSIGALMAYEVASQLQGLGQTVDSIVMLDGVYFKPDEKLFDPSDIEVALAEAKYDVKFTSFQVINLLLLPKVMLEPENVMQILIHRDELNLEDEDDVFIDKLLELSRERGLSKTEAQFRYLIQSTIKVQQAYQSYLYRVLPLPDPEGVACYFFRNKSEVSFGVLEPFYSIKQGRNLDYMNYWEEWEAQFPNLYIINVDSPNHMMMLSEHTKSYESITSFCEQLYSAEGMSKGYMDMFLKEHDSSKNTKYVSSVKNISDQNNVFINQFGNVGN